MLTKFSTRFQRIYATIHLKGAFEDPSVPFIGNSPTINYGCNHIF